MSTAQTWQIESTSSDETLALGEQIGRKLIGGEIIELVGDLGSGKTTLVKGLARGMGSSAHVHSPSFNIENIYETEQLTLHHFDFYRLHDPGLIFLELKELIRDKKAVIVIEWAQSVKDLLTRDHIIINIHIPNENLRHFDFHLSKKHSYIIS